MKWGHFCQQGFRKRIYAEFLQTASARRPRKKGISLIFYGNFAKVYHLEFVRTIDRYGLVSVNYLRLEVPDFRKLIRPGLDGPAGIPESSRGSTCGPDRRTRRMSGPSLHRSCLVCNGIGSACVYIQEVCGECFHFLWRRRGKRSWWSRPAETMR